MRLYLSFHMERWRVKIEFKAKAHRTERQNENNGFESFSIIAWHKMKIMTISLRFNVVARRVLLRTKHIICRARYLSEGFEVNIGSYSELTNKMCNGILSSICFHSFKCRRPRWNIETLGIQKPHCDKEKLYKLMDALHHWESYICLQ